MSNLVNMSEAASLALHAMVLLSTNSGKQVSTREIASRLHASEAHLSKVLQRLAKAGLVKAVRGPKGGFILGRAGDEITLLDVYESIEGRLVPKGCIFDKPVCRGGDCIFDGLLESANTRIRDHLAEAKLSNLTGVYGRMEVDN